MAFELGSAYGRILIDVSRVLQAADQARGAFTTIENGAKRVGAAMTRAGDEMTRGITLPLAGIGIAAGKAAMGFEESMQKIVGLVGVAQEQVDEWSGDLQRMGPELGRGPRELADALYFVTSAGIANSKAMSAVEASGKAAAAGLGETKVIADAVTSAMNAYAKQNLEAGDATGILVAAVREGKGEASEFAGSIGRVIPVAAQLGVSFDQVAAAMAAQTLVGFDAAESATNLSGIFSAFLKPSKQASETLEGFGLSAEGVRRSLAEDGLLATLAMLRDTIGDDDEALAQIFPNVRAFRGLLSLVGENAEKTREVFQELAVATEEDLNKAFAAVSETSGFKFKQAMAGMQSSLIDLGATVLPVVLPVLQQLVTIVKDVVAWFKSLPEPVQQTVVQVLAITAALGPLLSIGGRLVSGFGALVGVFNTLSGAFVAGAKAAGTVAKTGFEVVQYLSEAGALTPALALKLGVLGAGLVVIAKYLEQVGVAGKATNEELIKMSRSGDLFQQAAASTEVWVHGSQRLRDAFIEHQDEMRAKLLAGQVTLEAYNAEIERSARAAGVWREEISDWGDNFEVVDEAVKQFTQEELDAIRATEEFTKSFYTGELGARLMEHRMREAGYAVEELGDKSGGAAADVDGLAEAMQRNIAMMANARGRAIEYTADQEALNEKLAELKQIEEEIAEKGPAYTAQIANKKMSVEERATAEAKLAQAIGDLAEQEAKGGDVDADRAVKMATLKEKIAELQTALGTHAGAVGGATAEQLKHRDALLADIEAMKEAQETARATEAWEALVEAWKAGTLSGQEFEQRAVTLNAITGLYSQEALGAALAQERLLAALADPTNENWAQVLLANKAAIDGQAQALDDTGKKVEKLGKQDLMDMAGNAQIAQGKVMETVSTVSETADAAVTAVGKVMTALAELPVRKEIVIAIRVEGQIPGMPPGTLPETTTTPFPAGPIPRGSRQAGGRLLPGVMTTIDELGLTAPEVVIAPRGGYVLTKQDAMEALAGKNRMAPKAGDTYHVTINDAAAMRLWLDEQRRRKGSRIEANL